MKNLFSVLWVLGFSFLFVWCSSQNVWDVDYDLTNEVWREMHCSAMFQKAGVATLKSTYWLGEKEAEDGYIVEWRMDTDKGIYSTTCIYPKAEGDWAISISPEDDLSWSINPAVQYCINTDGAYGINLDGENMFWECRFADGTSCEAWTYFYWKCPTDLSETNVLDFPVETEEERIVACEENVWYYLNYNTWSFTWQNEEEAWASFSRDGHVVYEKWGEKWEDDVNCYIDMVDKSVKVEFSNHNYLGAIEAE